MSNETTRTETTESPFQKVQSEIVEYRDWREDAARNEFGVGEVASAHMADIGRSVSGIRTVATLLYADTCARNEAGHGMLPTGMATALLDVIKVLSDRIDDRTEAFARVTHPPHSRA